MCRLHDSVLATRAVLRWCRMKRAGHGGAPPACHCGRLLCRASATIYPGNGIHAGIGFRGSSLILVSRAGSARPPLGRFWADFGSCRAKSGSFWAGVAVADLEALGPCMSGHAGTGSSESIPGVTMET